jgi:pilus assembly protein Flp/PilA
MKQFIARFIKEEEGQDLIEYALLAALIAVLMVASLNGLRTAIQGVFTTVGTSLS